MMVRRLEASWTGFLVWKTQFDRESPDHLSSTPCPPQRGDVMRERRQMETTIVRDAVRHDFAPAGQCHMTGTVHPHRLAHAPWLKRAETRAVLRALDAQGHASRFVGGIVRNALIGRAVSDIDIATTALPDETIKAALAAGLAAVPTGIDHGTVTVVANHVPHEVTTLRRDVTTDGRRATVAYTKDWQEDACRRDLTINALYCDGDGTVTDYVGGMADLEARRVRFIGAARDRIREDYLRILRFFRFTAEYSAGVPDAIGLAACDAERGGLAQLSAERVRAEVLKLLVSDSAVAMTDVMHGHGYLLQLFGTEPDSGTFSRLVAIERVTRQSPDAILRLAALVVHGVEDAQRLGRTLRLAKTESVMLRHVAEARLTDQDIGDARAARVRLYRTGEERYRAWMLRAWARSAAAPDDAAWRHCMDAPRQAPVAEMPISGRDIVKAGVPPGPEVGRLVRLLEAWWIERDFAPDAASILAELKRRLAAG